jgi:hypothetical protein
MINKLFLLFTALMYGWLGGWALFDPASYVDDVGLSMTSNLGSAEIRSVYGGINFLVGLSALYALLKPQHEEIFFQILLFFNFWHSFRQNHNFYLWRVYICIFVRLYRI